MGAGRPAKSEAQKIRDGSFRADRVNWNEPQPSEFDAFNPFSEETELHAFKMWEMIVPELMERFSVGKGERALVQAYCVFYQRAMAADEELEASGSLTVTDDMGTTRVNPVVKVSEASWDRVIKFGSLLGLDPINRRRVRGPKNGPLGIVPGPATLALADRARDRNMGPDDVPEKKTTGDPLLDSLE